jgi:hypothetical protein
MTELHNSLRTCLLLSAAVALPPLLSFAQSTETSAATTAPRSAPATRDGQHDFDFEIGTWKTHLRRLLHPLTGSTTWVEYEGTTVVRPVWSGRANLVELEAEGASGHIEALSLRLYDPRSRQWALNFANAASGRVGVPTVGEFRDGRGEFFDQETLDGRAILVRFVITRDGADTCRFEQAFSGDGGESWEINWIATDTRIDGRERGERTKEEK